LICRIAGGFAVFWRYAWLERLLRLEPSKQERARVLSEKTHMAITSIESVLQQMRSISQAAQAGERSQAASGAEAAGGGFAGEFKKSLDRISDAQQQASGQAEAFELGKPGVALNDVMVDMQKASIGFQMGLQVRNKVVSAYQEVMNMQA
jgi:flagellar hook-basal body complex protein FliE